MNQSYGVSISRPFEEVFSCGLFDCIEYCKTYIADGADFENMQSDAQLITEYSRKYNVAVRSFHLPFSSSEEWVFEPASLTDEARDVTFENTKRLLDVVIPMGIRYLVLHGSLRVEPENRGKHLDCFVDYLQKLCDYVAPYGITVAVETLKPRCIGNGLKEHLYIMEHTERKNLGICFDSNHLLEEDNYAFLENTGQYVVTTHFSDFDGIDERHWYPGRGINDWKRITGILADKGYDQPWVFEVTFPDKTATAEECRTMIAEWEAMFA